MEKQITNAITSELQKRTDATKQEQVTEEINKAAADVDGAETAAAPAPAAGDNYDDWD